VNLQDFAGVT